MTSSFPEGDSLTAVQLEDHPATLSRKYRSWVTASTVPGIARGSVRATPRIPLQVIGRFIQKQDIGILEEEPAESYAAALSSERTLTGVSPGGHGGRPWLVPAGFQGPGVCVIDLLLQRGLFLQECVEIRVRVGELVAALLRTASGSCAVCATPSSTMSFTVLFDPAPAPAGGSRR